MAGFDVWSVIKVPFPVRLMITSARNREWAGDVEISDVSHADLTAASRVRCAKVATMEAADAETIGPLPAPDRAAVADALEEFLGDQSRRL